MKDVTPNSKGFNPFPRVKDFNAKNIRQLYLPLLIIIGLYYYVFTPSLHYASLDFWIFLGLILIGMAIIEGLADSSDWIKKVAKGQVEQVQLKKLPKKYQLLLAPLPVMLIVYMISSLIFSPFFMAKDYANLIQPQTREFAQDFPETDINAIPLVDRDSAMRLGSRKLGSLTDLVSQFQVSEEYTQININAKPYRVTPLQYDGFFKWLNNFKEGIPYYLQVDNVTGEVLVQKPEKPIKYSYADKFGRNIMRHLHFNYPFALFDHPSFEIDDQGTPYYIATTYKRMFFLREPEPNGIIMVNAMTGEHKRYAIKDIPKWVDRVYGAGLILHQIELNGLYHNGYWNTLFAKKGVIEPTEGYNYLPMNDDLYLYTGLTSVSADASNIGFILVNLRTKETVMYPLSAAEEFSAMASAEGAVQETGYKATFPLLINLNGKAMYILSLKDSAGLIKKYALIDCQNYQQVYHGRTVAELMTQYAKDYPQEVQAVSEDLLKEITGQVEGIQAVVKDGQTVYFFMVDGKVYQAPLNLNQYLPFVEKGDPIKAKMTPDQGIYSIDLSEKFGHEAQSNSSQESANPEQTKDQLTEALNQ